MLNLDLMYENNKYNNYNNFELYEKLREEAEQARISAYCPYSGFSVGAAVLTANGKIYTGCNVENSSYPLGICAEKVAVSKAVSDGEREISAIAISGGEVGKPSTFCPPCGACRQFLSEFCPKEEGKEMMILLSNHKIYSLSELLPVKFVLD